MVTLYQLHRGKQVISGNKIPGMACFILFFLFISFGVHQTFAQSKAPKRRSLNPEISDNYQKIAAFKYHNKWGSHNVHDPTVIKTGKWYYLYSTDVAYGWRNLKRVGIQIRKSKDLIHWKFVGWAFNGIPGKAKKYVTQKNNGKPPRNIWAPYIMKVGNRYRLYYAVAVFGSKA